MRNSLGQYIGTFEDRVAPIGAGGFVIGMDFSSDGSRMIHWADVFNGYIRNKGEEKWKLLLRTDNLDPVEYDPRVRDADGKNINDTGVYAGRIAPSNKDIIYAAWNGYIFKTTDGGANFFRTAFPRREMESNMGPQRRFNRTIEIHPTDPNQVLVSTGGDGVLYSLDGGASWTQLDLPSPTNTYHGSPGKCLLAIDPSNPNYVYIHVYGVGMFRSDDGVAGPYAQITGGPDTASCLVTSPTGVIYACRFRTLSSGEGSGPLWKYTRTDGWEIILAAQVQPDQVAVDPFDENHLITVDENGSLWRRSRDGGQTWAGIPNEWRGPGETNWFSNRSKAMYPAQLMFDPVVEGRLWVSEGIGISYADLPEDDSRFVFLDYSSGNEELVSFAGFSAEGYPPLLTCWDKPIWRMDNLRKPTNMWKYPVPQGGSYNNNVVTIGHWIDNAIDDPDFFAAVVGQGSVYNGYSVDGGKNWQQFSGVPEGGWRPGGCVAVGNKNNIIITSSNNGGAFYTLDGGETWNPVAFGAQSPVTNWANAYYVHRQNISADKTRPGVFCGLIHDLSHPSGRGGVFLTTDGGVTWTQRLVGLIQPGTTQFGQTNFGYIPGKTGELLYADCQGTANQKLMWSKDDGATWTALPYMNRIRRWSFGKAKAGSDYPVIFVSGTYNGVVGYYISDDWLATPPKLLTRFPNNSFAAVNGLVGDMNKYGRYYVGFGSNGWAIIDYGKRFALAPARTTT